MTYVVGDSFGDSPHKLTTGMRHFEQALRVDRPPSALSFATSSFLPATQGQRSKDVSSLKGASKAALRCRSQAATVGVWLKSARQSGSSNGLRVCVI
jgi:hypothetical protein